ncbi:MAG: transglycosylase SLT domain-containing protein [Halorhodospira sp.]
MSPTSAVRGLLCVLLAPLLLGLPAGAANPPLTGHCSGSYTELFHEALEAARADDWPRVAEVAPCLGKAHPMAAYIDFHRLRAALPEAEPERVLGYRETYADTPLAGVMHRLAVRRYAEAGRYAAVRRIASEPPEGRALRCHWWRAHLESRRDQALAFAAKAWQSGRSQPAACDGLFEAARAAGVIDERAIWQRMRRAFRSDEQGMMRYLAGLLEGARWQQAAQWLQRLHREPEAVVELDDADLPLLLRRQLTGDALWRLAEVDTAAALARLQEAGTALPSLLDGERQQVTRNIAWYAIIRGIREHRPWLDRWLLDQGDPQILGQRLRRAVIEQAWTDVLFWYARLPESAAGSARWQYWLGRARVELGDRQGARDAWRQAAGERSFWGFLAAERSGHTYALEAAQPAPAAPEPVPGLLRTRILREGGKLRLARDEWHHLLAAGGAAHRRALADHAHQQAWHGLAITAALKAEAHHVLRWRFPHAYRETFQQAAAATGSEPYLLMAVARRESAFQRGAVSAAGARGVMQLMPATAREAAQRSGHPVPEPKALGEPAVNIRLGAEYLRRLLARFDGNRLLALAAYNAGPARVASWLEDDPKPFDVWIESIPYRETRDYVQAVLAYRAILAHRDGAVVAGSVVSGQEVLHAYGDTARGETLELSWRPSAEGGEGEGADRESPGSP